MATQKQHLVWIMMLGGIGLITLTRFLPHPPNFSPIAAMALFGGAFFRNKKLVLILPLAGMLLSDIIFQIASPGYGFYASMPYVYGSLLLISILGLLIQNNRKTGIVFGATIVSTILFFLVTNFGTWLSQGAYINSGTTKYLYAHNFAGLLECYTLAIPFLKYSFMGDLFFSAVLFGGYYLLAKNYKLQRA